MASPNSVSPAMLKNQLRQLRGARRDRQRQRRDAPARRITLKPSERDEVFAKTAGRCHICGGTVEGTRWEADHVLAHSAGGIHAADNYLPAHSLCNNYRWDYSAEEFQWVLKIGVWARLQMEQDTPFGDEILRRFCNYERRREARRKVRI